MSLALLEAAADPSRPWTFAFIGITFAAYLFIGWRSRVRETSGFYVAGQGVPAIANGAATAADWMSAASFLGMAGLISVKGSDGSMYLMGWTGGRLEKFHGRPLASTVVKSNEAPSVNP